MSAQGPERLGGLSQTHTRTREPEPGRLRPAFAAVWEGGSLVSVGRERSQSQPGSGPPAGGGKRDRIRDYRPAVKLRCQNTIGKVQRSERPCLLTLTYPDWWHPSPEDFARHKRRLHERMRRRWPRVAGIFVREHHADGRPHLHGLVYGLRTDQDVILFRAWVAGAWFQAVNIQDERRERHLRAGTSLERARSARAVRSYVTKYVSKSGAQKAVTEPWGRWWWIHNSAAVPWARLRIHRFDDRTAVGLMRMARKLYGLKPWAYPTRTFLSDTGDWERLLVASAVAPP